MRVTRVGITAVIFAERHAGPHGHNIQNPNARHQSRFDHGCARLPIAPTTNQNSGQNATTETKQMQTNDASRCERTNRECAPV